MRASDNRFVEKELDLSDMEDAVIVLYLSIPLGVEELLKVSRTLDFHGFPKNAVSGRNRKNVAGLRRAFNGCFRFEETALEISKEFAA